MNKVIISLSKTGFFQRFPIPRHFEEIKPEITLYRAVLDRLLLDILKGPDLGEDYEESKLFFETPSEDRTDLSTMACLNEYSMLLYVEQVKDLCEANDLNGFKHLIFTGRWSD